MENGAKALVMAGGVLIGILVISFMMLALRAGGSINSEYNVQMSETELLKFNSQFEAFHRNNNTIFDVVTVVNLAYSINQQIGWNEYSGVTVILKAPNGTYKIRSKDSIAKNKMFKGDTTGTIDIYNEILIDENIYYAVTYTDEVTGNQVTKTENVPYKCEIYYNEDTGRVDRMEFEKVTT